MQTLPVHIAKALIRKWKRIRKGDIEKRDNDWKITKRVLNTIVTQHYVNVPFYLDRIAQADRIIHECQFIINSSKNETKKTTLE